MSRFFRADDLLAEITKMRAMANVGRRDPVVKRQEQAETYRQKKEAVGLTHQVVIAEQLRWIDPTVRCDHDAALIICGYNNKNGNSLYGLCVGKGMKLLRPSEPPPPLKVIFARTLLAVENMRNRLGSVRYGAAKQEGTTIPLTRADAGSWRRDQSKGSAGGCPLVPQIKLKGDELLKD
jgi:hypothetical protein